MIRDCVILRHTPRLVAIALACTASIGQTEVILTTRPSLLEERDAASFQLVRTVYVPHSFLRATYDGDRFWIVDHASSGITRLVSVNPADGMSSVIGSTSVTLGTVFGLDIENQSGDLWLALGQDLYTVDRTNATMTYRGYLTGCPNNETIWAIAIESPQRVYAMGSYTPSGYALYEFDLTTFQATTLGRLALPPGSFDDLAMRPNGDLLGVFRKGGSVGVNGLYRIDPVTVTATVLVTAQFNPMYAVAVGPGTAMASYCTAKTNTLGCAPTISGLGFASSAGTSGFAVSAHFVLNNKPGRLLHTTAGQAALPFAGGTLCLAAPFYRSPVVDSGGTAAPANDCSGIWERDFNAYLQSTVPMPPGTTFQCQWYGRDPGFPPPNNVQLSDALEFTLAP